MAAIAIAFDPTQDRRKSSKYNLYNLFPPAKESLELDAERDNKVVSRMAVEGDEKDAVSLENESVHRVYDIIAGHFSDTRYKV